MMIAVGKGVFKYIGYELNCFTDIIISYTYVKNNWSMIVIISIVLLENYGHKYDAYV